MKYHIYWNGELIASFANPIRRDQILEYWHNRFPYAAEQITKKDD